MYVFVYTIIYNYTHIYIYTCTIAAPKKIEG